MGTMIALGLSIGFRRLFVFVASRCASDHWEIYEARLAKDRENRRQLGWMTRIVLVPIGEEVPARGIPLWFVVLLPQSWASDVFIGLVWAGCDWAWGLGHLWKVDHYRCTTLNCIPHGLNAICETGES